MKDGNEHHREHIVHGFAPVCSARSRILILGSLPSQASREAGFYYGHTRNRFWRVLAAVYGTEVPQGVEEKKAFLLSHGVALWDVIHECDILRSSDASIKNAVPNDISSILSAADIRAIYTNGSAAFELYNRHILPSVGRRAIKLPSTSPANAACSLEDLIEAWSIIKD